MIKSKNTSQKNYMNDRNRNDDKTIERDKQLMNLRYNLLIIRETYRILHASQTSMKKFYEIIGVTDDVYSIFLNGSTISQNQRKQLVDVITSCGISKEYLSTTRAPKIFATPELKEYADDYFNAESKQVKDDVLLDIRKELDYNWRNNNPNMAMLICGVYVLTMKISGTTEIDLQRGREILDKLVQHDFSDSTLKSKAFAGFITELAKMVNTIENYFPDFYAVAQQIKEEKTPEYIMNEITINLKSLSNIGITTQSANSESCLNMMREISNIMLQISSKFN